MTLAKKHSWMALTVAAALMAAACGGGDDGDATGTATAGSSDATSVSGDTTSIDSNLTGGAATVDANTATVEEMAAAFEAAGISNADKWAREVEEYRPYPTDDPSFAMLRQELSKYNPSNEVLEQIIATLSL